MTIAVASEAMPGRRSSVDGRLSAFFDDNAERVARHGAAYLRLWDAARRSTLGGKRIRPALVMNAFDAFGGASEADAASVAVAFELLHTAFLLHDDVIDGDTVRRGRLNLIGEFARETGSDDRGGARGTQWGRAAAILAGDLLLHAAGSQIARLDVAAQTRTALLDLLDESLFVTAAGELYDVAYATGTEGPAMPEVLAMTQWKTAHYSFQAPLQAGAILAGAPADAVDALGAYGRCTGTAFQLRDDLLGVFGSEEDTGKSCRSDLRGGKRTALLQYARHTTAADELRTIVGDPDIGSAQIRHARAALERCGARTYVEGLITQLVAEASAQLDAGPIPHVLHEYLAAVAEHAGRRVS